MVEKFNVPHLQKAIQNEELLLHLQPRVNAATGKIISAEALIRWKHPECGLIPPMEFIPLAEESGLILDIGDWVLKEVCQFFVQWRQYGIPPLPVSINISAKRFLKPDLVEKVIGILGEYNISPSLIEIEITETALIEYEDTVMTAINGLKDLGIKIALDDFGTGYSSLNYVRQFPIDTIKIDRSYIKNISVSKSDEVIIQSIIFMAKGLNMNIVAEGVETLGQLSFLRKEQCNEIQGYLFSKPVEEETYRALLQQETLTPLKYNY